MERRRMPLRPRSVTKLATQIVLLFIAFAVFSWGMQAKVSLYKAHPSPSTVAAAKLLTEERTAQITVSVKASGEWAASIDMLRLIALGSSNQVIPFSAFRLRQLQTSLYRTCGCDFQSTDLMRRPPPSRA